MRKIPVKTRQIAVAVSTVAVIIPNILLLIISANTVFAFANELFLLPVLGIVAPSAILGFARQRGLSTIEVQMPVLVSGGAQ
jgi:hypothetical protein